MCYICAYLPACLGPLPPQISLLTHIQEIQLPFNGLVGKIPPQIGRLGQLCSFNIANNFLTGMCAFALVVSVVTIAEQAFPRQK